MPKLMTVLVAGATGKQGGAVIRLLLHRGHHVRALTRRPGSAAVARLHALGADIYEGDLDEAAAVLQAAEGADAFFLMATPFTEGVKAEVRQARRAADAAKEAGVRHLIYSSVAGADRNTGIKHFDNKREVESYVQKLDIPYTLVAPIFVMENLVGPMLVQGLRAGILSMPLPPIRDLQVVALADIAGFVRLALERPGEFQGKRIEIASDSLSGPQAASVLAQVTGTSISFSETSLADVRAQSEEQARMWEWIDEVGYSTDLEALRRTYPEVGWHTLAQWAHEQDWTVTGAVSPEQPSA